MAAFSAFYNILPDPSHKIGLAGQVDASGLAGPGYAGITLRSSQKILNARYNSQTVDSQIANYHKWLVDIDYNPLPCNFFHRIYAFLLIKQATLKPFYISIPPYASQPIADKTTSGTVTKGSSTITIVGTDVEPGMAFVPLTHQKFYIVTRVETETDYFTPEGSPGAGNTRLHITPTLQESITTGSTLDFTDPLMLVRIEGDMNEYEIDGSGLFKYSLSLEEVKP